MQTTTGNNGFRNLGYFSVDVVFNLGVGYFLLLYEGALRGSMKLSC